MNLKINRETVRAPEIICSCIQEQSVELDYILPDYYPEIFRIVRCFADCEVTSWSVSGDRVTYELTVKLSIIYCSDKGSVPQSVEQKLTYSRTVSLEKPCDDPVAFITAFADKFSCRAVNKRRIDIRGAVTIKIVVNGETQNDVISDCFGGNIRLKKQPFLCTSQSARIQKRFTVSDEFELPEDSPSISSVLRSDAVIVSTDKKLVAGKAAAKGELKLFILYTPAEEGSDCPVYSLQFTIPYSCLIDIGTADEGTDCRITPQVISCDIKPRSDGNGISRSLECDVVLLIECVCIKNGSIDIVCDEYSTAFSSSHSVVPVKLRKPPVSADSSIVVKGVCECHDSPLSEVYYAWCDGARINAVISDGMIRASGNALMYVLGAAESGDIVVCETEVPVDEPISSGGEKPLSDDAQLRLTFSPVSCTYTISSENKAEIKTEISVRGYAADCETVNALTDITVDETAPREKNSEYALKLYFAESGEDLWNIAKECGASVESIMEENELDSSLVSEKKMLLIPME